jgi:hypothetical protein
MVLISIHKSLLFIIFAVLLFSFYPLLGGKIIPYMQRKTGLNLIGSFGLLQASIAKEKFIYFLMCKKKKNTNMLINNQKSIIHLQYITKQISRSLFNKTYYMFSIIEFIFKKIRDLGFIIESTYQTLLTFWFTYNDFIIGCILYTCFIFYHLPEKNLYVRIRNSFIISFICILYFIFMLGALFILVLTTYADMYPITCKVILFILWWFNVLIVFKVFSGYQSLPDKSDVSYLNKKITISLNPEKSRKEVVKDLLILLQVLLKQKNFRYYKITKDISRFVMIMSPVDYPELVKRFTLKTFLPFIFKHLYFIESINYLLRSEPEEFTNLEVLDSKDIDSNDDAILEMFIELSPIILETLESPKNTTALRIELIEFFSKYQYFKKKYGIFPKEKIPELTIEILFIVILFCAIEDTQNIKKFTTSLLTIFSKHNSDFKKQ